MLLLGEYSFAILLAGLLMKKIISKLKMLCVSVQVVT